MLGITGATGKLGAKVASRLEKAGERQRLIVRDVARAPNLKGAEIALVSSYGDKPAMEKALNGIKTLFLVSAQDSMGLTLKYAQKGLPPPPYDRLREHITAINAAVTAGVEHIVYLSFLNAAENAVFTFGREHFLTEAYIRETGLHFTFLRPCLYMDNIPLRVSAEGIIRAPAGKGKAAWVTRDDIADVAAAVLTGKGHEGWIYDVTGPEALPMAETAAKISAACGRKVVYIEQTPEEAKKARNFSGLDMFEAMLRSLTGHGLSDDEIDMWLTHYTQIAAGALDVVSDTVPKLTGHRAQSLAEYLHLHPESYTHITG
jgi:NAD(P)H dehydrogenase (quinone)